MKIALLYMVNRWPNEVRSEFADLSKLRGIESWLLIDVRTPNVDEICSSQPRCHRFSVDDLLAMPYHTIPGMAHRLPFYHAHFPVLSFYQAHPEFDFYWFIEYDVRYKGLWQSFFDCFARYEHDFLVPHLRTYQEEPDWYWWRHFCHPLKSLPKEEWIRSFNVIYRISNRAIDFAHHALQQDWHGHHEMLIATLLQHYGFSLLDFGGHGSFVLKELRNKAYTSVDSTDGTLIHNFNAGTIRWRPVMPKVGDAENMLYHPVKPVVLKG